MKTKKIPKKAASVFSNLREFKTPSNRKIFKNGSPVAMNRENKMDGLVTLGRISDSVIPAVFFDPQYRGVMDKMSYGNEGARQKGRALLKQMNEDTILSFVKEIDRILIPSGHLFLWIDKFHLVEGTSTWFEGTSLMTVDLITWDKGKIGMGYRTRRRSEYLLVLQKIPTRAKGVWTKHNIPDVWSESLNGRSHHPHRKPVNLQRALIEAVTQEGDFIVDPAAGGYSVLEACRQSNRKFLGSDLRGKFRADQ